MAGTPTTVLAINSGSSSIKFALYPIQAGGEPEERRLRGRIERIGSDRATLLLAGGGETPLPANANTHEAAVDFLIGWLELHADLPSVNAIGHRLVHGMHFTQSMQVTPEVLAELHRLSPVDPDHMPGGIQIIEAFAKRLPDTPQLACFDTTFHRTMPRVARLLPIPRRFEAMGVERYGFHGLSYAYLMKELARVAGEKAASGRVILAHLGSGASLAAVRAGKSIDTSMGFTPTSGLPMGTRPGDLDAGVAWYILRSEKLSAGQFNHLINQECGLLGVSGGISSDMRDLLAKQSTDIRAAEAVELFCYQTRKWIGSFAAALRGLDTLVFSGGIGENAGEVRQRICDGLQFLGIELDAAANANNGPMLSLPASRVAVRMIRTDEEWMIAREVCDFLK